MSQLCQESFLWAFFCVISMSVFLNDISFCEVCNNKLIYCFSKCWEYNSTYNLLFVYKKKCSHRFFSLIVVCDRSSDHVVSRIIFVSNIFLIVCTDWYFFSHIPFWVTIVQILSLSIIFACFIIVDCCHIETFFFSKSKIDIIQNGNTNYYQQCILRWIEENYMNQWSKSTEDHQEKRKGFH
jgi:hypothetical protein